MIKSISIKFFFLLFFFELVKCAKIIHPEGGPKDEKSALLINSSIKNGQTTVDIKTKSIVFEFDKPIKIDDISNIFINANTEFDIVIFDKKLILKFKKDLKEDTQYYINFDKTIKDTTESNISENISINFSTSKNIDENEIRGTVYDQKTILKEKSIMVCLFEIKEEDPEKNSKIHLSNRPNYFTYTNEKGEFYFSFIKKGKYKIVAFDAFDCYSKIDYAKNKYGFGYEYINFDSNNKKIELNIGINFSDIRPLEIVSKKKIGKNFEVKFNKSIASFEEVSFDTRYKIYKREDDTLNIFYLRGNKNDRGDEIKFSKKIKVRDIYGCENVFEVDTILNSNDKNNLEDKFFLSEKKEFIGKKGTIEIKSNKPIDREKINLYMMNFKINEKDIFVKEEDFIFDEKNNSFKIKYDFSSIDLEDESKIEFTIKSQTFSFLDQSYNKISNFIFIFDKYKSSSIQGFIYTDSKNFTIECVDREGNVIDKILKNKNDSHDYLFQGLKEGKYIIRILIHQRFTENWFAGNIEKNLKADPIYFCSKVIDIPSSFESKQNDIYCNEL